jgi:hypothetical protein
MGPARRITALSVLSSLIVLYFLGDTLNTMTLGGLALAIGILVDHSTVTIEEHPPPVDRGRTALPQATLHAPPASPCRPWCRHWRSAVCSPRSSFSMAA